MQEDDITLRKAERADAPAVLELIRSLATYERLAHEVTATTELLESHLFGDRPIAEVLIAETSSGSSPPRVSGFALYFYTFSTFLAKPTLYLEDLFVEPALRGRGIGERLLRALAQIAIERGCGRMEWSVLDWNEPALKFYARLGAKPMSEWTVHRVTGAALSDLAGGVKVSFGGKAP